MDDLPPIRYATTTDGFRVAFYAIGKGSPVLLLRPHPSSHLTLEWQSPTSQAFYRWLERHVTLIRLDFRGSGLSERKISGLTLKSIADDINAVIERLALERVGILANGGFAGICALSYAAGFPERVSRIVSVDVSQGESELNRAVTDLRMASPAIHSRVRASVMVGGLGSADTAALTAIYEASTDPTGHRAFVELTRTTDIRPNLPRVQARTLFMHTEGNEIFPIAVAQELAAIMPSAALHVRPKGSASSSLTNEAEWQTALAFLLARDPEASSEWAVKERGNDNSAIDSERGHGGLSRREADVLRQMALGRTNQEIATKLVISRSTVSHHLTNIFRKTNSANRTEAAGYAHRHGFM